MKTASCNDGGIGSFRSLKKQNIALKKHDDVGFFIRETNNEALDYGNTT
jgi:hypothetical protein